MIVGSCHRVYVDQFLTSAANRMRGRVLDIGGTRANKKGSFRPPTEGVASWEYLNIDAASQPDYLSNAETMPLTDGSVDCFLMCEVLEHLERPEAVLLEAARVLKHGGVGVMTMPFLYPVHADPHDFQRWTKEKLERELKLANFEVVRIDPLGGPIAVLHDLILNLTWRSPPSLSMRVLSKLLAWSAGPALWLDRRFPDVWKHITSGWGILVIRSPVETEGRAGA